MKQVLDSLLLLYALETGTDSGQATSRGPEEIRKKIPAHILQNYDRLRARGKKGVAFVRHGVCANCHMQVAVGLLAELHREDALSRCENCGCYLCLGEEPAPVLEMPPRAVKPARRGRPRKVQTHVVE